MPTALQILVRLLTNAKGSTIIAYAMICIALSALPGSPALPGGDRLAKEMVAAPMNVAATPKGDNQE
ncbi:hypothetical protein [Ruegeria arenilitoris]|uniref:hypothetical protein n=1 Tax=Ruegeria arenilitoris TaxID=1173585 RepID=UPI0020C3F99C|nr:hypothetical protein [Ruegeria arenilitoris]